MKKLSGFEVIARLSMLIVFVHSFYINDTHRMLFAGIILIISFMPRGDK